MELKRHVLIDVTDSGREAILDDLAGNGPGSGLLREKYSRVLLPEKAGARIPGIARREEGTIRPGCIPVGFSAPMTDRSGRLRAAAFARHEDVARMTSPYELLSLNSVRQRNASTMALGVAEKHARALGLALGVWGSAALELYTGLPCTHQNSDLDLLVAPASRETLSRFLIEVEAVEKSLGLRIDVELDCPNGYGVQLKELFGRGRTVIGKSLTDVALFPCERIFADLPANEPMKGSLARGGLNGRADTP